MYILILNFLFLALLVNLIFYIPAFSLKSDKFTDITYSLTFIFLTSVAILLSQNFSIENIILAVMIFVWAFRLGLFLFVRILKMKTDKRFDDVRDNFFRFGYFWLIQAFTAWVLLIPTFVFFNIGREGGNLSILLEGIEYKTIFLMISGFVIWLAGLIIESLSDYQKQTYINNRKKDNLPRHWVDIGLWKYVRHPNYLGEVLIWIGIFIFTLSKFNILFSIIGLVSPIFIYTLIRFFTGVPQLTENSQKYFGENPDFIEYKKKTGLIFPKIF